MLYIYSWLDVGEGETHVSQEFPLTEVLEGDEKPEETLSGIISSFIYFILLDFKVALCTTEDKWYVQRLKVKYIFCDKCI